MSTPTPRGEKRTLILITTLSIAVPLVVALLLLFPNFFELKLGIERGTLPAFHAIINGTTAFLLLLGLWLVMRKRYQAHKKTMLTAFGLSAVFLVSYVLSKMNAEPIPYGGEGWLRGLYFFILVSHILLSIAVLPLAMLAIYRGLVNQNERHRKVVRWAYPIWLYVAITGVLVYLFMQPYY